MTGMKSEFLGVFTLEVGGRPTLAFEAGGVRDAKQICKESWLRTDLVSLKSSGVPLWDGKAALSIRPANAEEAIAFGHVAAKANRSDDDDMMLAYLVELGGPPVG
jgi:hypothetical protein